MKTWTVFYYSFGSAVTPTGAVAHKGVGEERVTAEEIAAPEDGRLLFRLRTGQLVAGYSPGSWHSFGEAESEGAQ